MFDDEVRIRTAEADDAEELRDIAWSSMEYWDMDSEELNSLREILDINPLLIEKNVAYVAENSETEEILGFYFVESMNGKYWLRYLCVNPDFMGTGLGETLFLSACEMAEEIGAEEIQIISHPNGEEFYTHMGAKTVGDIPVDANGKTLYFKQLEIKLTTE